MRAQSLIHSLQRQGRGFLVLMVVSVLAVLLVIGIGFLSFTRGEVQAVSSQRDKGDTMDVVQSALDWTVANISNDLTSGGKFDPNKTVANAPGGNMKWWYRPYEKNTQLQMQTWTKSGAQFTPAYVKPGMNESDWVYLPADHFPGGGVRGRFMVQVFDPNSCININDWNDDGCPTQCQMAHMMMSAYGDQFFEKYRAGRDYGLKAWSGVSGSNQPYSLVCPIRYQEAWRAVTHTTRPPSWINGIDQMPLDNILSYYWRTTNSSYFGLAGADFNSIHSNLQSDGVFQGTQYPQSGHPRFGSGGGASLDNNSCNYFPPDPPDGLTCFGFSPAGWSSPIPYSGYAGAWEAEDFGGQPYYLSGFTTMAYTDPDTGRSPININTCYNSGESLPVARNIFPSTFTLEGVFNIASLRRIIQVGNFYDPSAPPGKQWLKAGTPADWKLLTPHQKVLVETLKTQLAYQYQETLCRYFTASYAHQPDGTQARQPGAPANYQPHNGGANLGFTSNAANRLFNPGYVSSGPAFGASAKPPTPTFGAYESIYNKAPKPGHACQNWDYSTVRFDTDLKSFRKWVHDDLLQMSTNYSNNSNFSPTGTAAVKSNPDPAPNSTDAWVNFDENFVPDVAPGMLDVRTAAAIYDNIVPGKPADLADFKGFKAYQVGDPLWELYCLQLARQEDFDDGVTRDDSPGGAGALDADGAYPNGVSYIIPGQYNPWGLWGATNAPQNGKVPVNDRQYNVYAYWRDNPYLRTLSGCDWATSKLINIKNSAGQDMDVLPKGRDICNVTHYTKTFGATPAFTPCGPWLDNDFPAVPYRQLAFSPDCFSTELTTTTTTFYIIINAQLVESASVASGNPKDVYWQNNGFVVEIAPDVMAETDVNAPLNDTFNYYQKGLPRWVKSFRPNGYSGLTVPGYVQNLLKSGDEFSALDNATTGTASCKGLKIDFVPCASLVARNWGDGTPSTSNNNPQVDRFANFWGVNYGSPTPAPSAKNFNAKDSMLDATTANPNRTPDETAGVASNPAPDSTDFVTRTGVDDWQGDSRGIPPAGGTPAYVKGAKTDESTFYATNGKGGSQTTRRVLVRAIWSLNQGLMQ